MPRGHWGVIYPIAGCLALASIPAAYIAGYGAGDISRQSNCENQQTWSGERGSNARQRCPEQGDIDRAGIPRSIERIASNPQPKDDGERQQRDLAAQEGMAVWAFWAASVAAIQAALSLLGLGALIYTLRQSDKSLAEARIANEIARDTAKRELRAYVGIEETSILPAGPEHGSGVVTFQLKNYGHSPAVRVETVISIGVARFQKGLPSRPETWDRVGKRLPVDVPPHSTIYRQMKLPAQVFENMFEIESGIMAVFIEIEIAYHDIFRNRHTQSTLFQGRGRRYLEKKINLAMQWPEVTV